MEAEFARTKEQLASENMVRNASLEIVFRVGKKCIPKCTSGIDKNALNRVFGLVSLYIQSRLIQAKSERRFFFFTTQN